MCRRKIKCKAPLYVPDTFRQAPTVAALSKVALGLTFLRRARQASDFSGTHGQGDFHSADLRRCYTRQSRLKDCRRFIRLARSIPTRGPEELCCACLRESDGTALPAGDECVEAFIGYRLDGALDAGRSPRTAVNRPSNPPCKGRPLRLKASRYAGGGLARQARVRPRNTALCGEPRSEVCAESLEFMSHEPTAAPDASRLQLTARAMRHRGPDGARNLFGAGSGAGPHPPCAGGPQRAEQPAVLGPDWAVLSGL